MHFSHTLTDSTLELLARNCPTLTDAGLELCPEVSRQCLETLPTKPGKGIERVKTS